MKAASASIRGRLLRPPYPVASIEESTRDPERDGGERVRDHSREDSRQDADDRKKDRGGKHDSRLDRLQFPLIGDRGGDRVADAQEARRRLPRAPAGSGWQIARPAAP